MYGNSAVKKPLKALLDLITAKQRNFPAFAADRGSCLGNLLYRPLTLTG
jgi:hypothetical protein